MKKLLFLCHEQFWPLTGGGTSGNFYIMKYFSQNGFEVTISTPLYQDVTFLKNEYGFKFEPFSPYYLSRKVRFRMLKYMLYGFLSIFHVMRLLSRKRYDVIYINNVIVALPFFLIKPFIKTPVTIRFTDFLSVFLYEHKKFPKFFINLLKFYEFRMASIFDRVFVITDAMKRELCRKKHVQEGKVVAILDGVNESVFNVESLPQGNRERVRKDLNVPLDAKLVIFHGTVEPHHGEDIIAGLIRQILEKRKDIHVLLIGISRGSGYNKIKQALKDDPRAHFLDFVEYHKIPAYIDASDVGMVPYPKSKSMDIILTLKLLEYLSLGVRSVTFDSEGIKEAFGKYDFVRTSRTTEEFINNILVMLEMGRSKEAADLIRRDFTWDRVAQRMRQEFINLPI